MYVNVNGIYRKVIQCSGNGQGECISCKNLGIWNRYWMSFLYEIDGLDGLFCAKCLNEMKGKGNVKCM